MLTQTLIHIQDGLPWHKSKITCHFLKVLKNQIGAGDIYRPLCSQNIQSEWKWGTFSPRLNLVTLLPGGICWMWWWVGSWCAVVRMECPSFTSHFSSRFFSLILLKEEVPEMGWDEHPGHIPSSRQRLWPDEDRWTQHTLQQVRACWKFPIVCFYC